MQRDTLTRLAVLIVAVAGCTALLWALTGFSGADDALEPTPRAQIRVPSFWNPPTATPVLVIPFQHTYIPQSEPYEQSEPLRYHSGAEIFGDGRSEAEREFDQYRECVRRADDFINRDLSDVLDRIAQC